MTILSFLRNLFAAGGEVSITGPARPIDLSPTEVVQEKPVRKYSERIIAGMGSGDSSDVNTYAKFDALPEAEKAKIRARSQLPRMADRQRQMLPGKQQDNPDGTIGVIRSSSVYDGISFASQEMGGGLPQEPPTAPIDANVIADVMDAAYVRDPKTRKLVLKDGLPQPDPNLGKDYK